MTLHQAITLIIVIPFVIGITLQKITDRHYRNKRKDFWGKLGNKGKHRENNGF